MRRFRGFTAPASLKHLHPPHHPDQRPCFRGFTAPASLKRQYHVDVMLPRRRFRGFTAPASLKPGDRVLGETIAGKFPGLYRPGLIEACRWPRRR